jgi:hypothetical protein
MSIEKVHDECGFSLRVESARVVLVTSAGAERDLTAPEANLWADVCQKVLKVIKRGIE